MQIKLPVLAFTPDVSAVVEWQLVETLFSQTGTVEILSLTACAIAVTSWIRTGQVWFLGWAAAFVFLLAGRLWLGRAYKRRTAAVGPRAWAWLFTIGALAAAALAGLAGWRAVRAHDVDVRFLFVTFLIWAGTGAPARNSAAPLAAIGQACGILVPVALAALLSRDPYLEAFAVFCIVQLVATIKVTVFLGRQTARMLVLNQKFIGASDEKKRLIDEVERVNAELTASNAALAVLSITDELTGLLNRRGFEARLHREWRRARRHQTPLSLLLIDIDHFKAFNDRYGHPMGDKCLEAVAAAISGSIERSADEVARYGGEEFAAILPDTDAAGAVEVADSVRRAVMAATSDDAASGVTASIGVATLMPACSLDRQMLVADADKALYRAKESGRNRVQLCETRLGQVEAPPQGARPLHSAA